MCLSCEDITRQSCTMARRWQLFGDFLPLGMEVGLILGDIVLDGDPAPPSPKGAQPPPQFSANVRCGQTTGWTKIPLGMEVGHGPGDFAFNGDPAPPRKRAKPHSIFGSCLLWPNGWMDQDTTWYGGKPLPRRRCVGWSPASPLNGA